MPRQRFIGKARRAKLRDLNQVQEIKQVLLSAVAEHKPTNIVIDFQNIEFIASIGFLAFLAVRRESGIEQIALCGLQDNVREVFMLCKLISSSNDSSSPFAAFSTVQEAIAAA